MTEEALALVAGQRLGGLVTLRRDGRPQTSNVVYVVADRQVRAPGPSSGSVLTM